MPRACTEAQSFAARWRCGFVSFWCVVASAAAPARAEWQASCEGRDLCLGWNRSLPHATGMSAFSPERGKPAYGIPFVRPDFWPAFKASNLARPVVANAPPSPRPGSQIGAPNGANQMYQIPSSIAGAVWATFSALSEKWTSISARLRPSFCRSRQKSKPAWSGVRSSTF